MFKEKVLDLILSNIKENPNANAFCIGGKYYTYSHFGQCVSKINKALELSHNQNTKVGLVINDDIETYASIIALWLNGYCYVPLHPHWPMERCVDICNQVELDLILDSSKTSRYANKNVIMTMDLADEDVVLLAKEDVPDDHLAYILFTSGSTGKPKGVQLTRGNLYSFIDAFFELYRMDNRDRCLQCFDLSFDLSIMSYCVPLTVGACVYTVSPDVIKYTYIGALLEEEKLTFALMTPSTIKYLRPFFGEIDGSSLKYSLFCGEALPFDITEEWAKCAKNAIIDNVYGPTEDTIFCSTYRYNREGENKMHNGILSIGRPMKNCQMVVLNDDNEESPVGEMGELCLSGAQLSIGYFKNEEKNKEAFFELNGIRWYRSGDVCFKDEDGDFLYSGRKDNQVKVQGFRIELGEIEYHSREISKSNTVCIANEEEGEMVLYLFIEGPVQDTKLIVDYMKSKMPLYMIPSHIQFIESFPLNNSDKVDRPKLKKNIVKYDKSFK